MRAAAPVAGLLHAPDRAGAGVAGRAAQRAAIAEGWQPARWAAFQLYGDWR